MNGIKRPATPAARLRPLLAALGYGGLVAGLLAVAVGTLWDLAERRAAVDDAAAMLERLQGGRLRAVGGTADGARQGGSPVIEGPTVTIAGASLMQRLSDAVTHHGGRITSSHVELQGTPFGADFIAVGASLELGQEELQALLYDLEAGLPFLFVGQLAARPDRSDADLPGTAGGQADGAPERLQVTLTVYGQWRGMP